MKTLSNTQILTVKKPDRRGRTKTPPSENYENIYWQVKGSFTILTKVTKILFDIEKYASRFDYARNIVELFDEETLNPILKGIFPTREEEGAPIFDTILFDPSKINMKKVILASSLLKFSSDYLLQAFPEQEYPNLHPRISDLIKDLNGMVDAFNRNQELKRQLEESKKHVSHFEPVGLGEHDRNYDVACDYCRETAMGKTKKETIEKIKHTPKCKAPKIVDENNPYKTEKWYIIKYPKKLLITWEERKKLDEINNLVS